MRRLKPSVWWAISILLFAASAYFWNLGEKIRHAEEAKREKQHTAALKSTASPAVPSISTESKTNAVSKRIDPKSYRVSNTTRPLAELQKDRHAILLRNAMIDTTRPLSDLKIPEKWRSKGEAGSYIVQLDHPLDKAFYDALKAAGAKFVSYIPNNAALIVAPLNVASQFSANPIPYEPHYKVDPTILMGRADTNEFFRITASAKDPVKSAIASLGGTTVGEDASPFGPSVVAHIDASKLPELAQNGSVLAIEPAVARARLNDLTRAKLAVSQNASNLINFDYNGVDYSGNPLNGSNVVVNVNDTGVDGSHPDLTNRVAGDFLTSLTDFDGHGTHVAGIIAGDGTMSTNVTFASGSPRKSSAPFYYPQQFRGKAPAVGIYAQAIDSITGAFISDVYLQTNAAAQSNVFISNNSWGYIGADPYSMPTASYDAAVRDARPDVKGSQPLIYVFAAGNSGQGEDNGQNAFSDTILSPAGGKNVITVGAVESLRNITNTIVYQDGGTLVTNAVWSGMTDSSSEIAAFSSRGNVGVGIEGDFGRFKPDVVAPGVFIVSTRSTNWTDPTNFITADVHSYPDQVVTSGQTNDYIFAIPADAVQMIVSTVPNPASPDPFPALIIYANQGTNPPTTFRGKGQASIGANGPATWTVGINNTNGQPVAYDLNIYVIRTNTFGTYFQELKKLNDGLAPFYRYESGTSMAAPAVSGVLALMEDYFRNRLNLKPSPALMKALLINGARTLNSIYDFEVRRITANDEGWGIVNVKNSIPSGLGSSNCPTVFIDQNLTNAISTGEARTWTLTPSSRFTPLRITLVWTDPPGNPTAAVKLVNDLDLIVTNLDTGEVYTGNNFQTGDVFTQSQDPVFDNLVDPDTINNVENVYIFGSFGTPLGSNYTVTVRGSRVNVNAVTDHPDNVAQDFALVVSGANAAAVTLTNEVATFDRSRLITVASNGVAMLYQHVGANTPLLSTPGTGLTNGMINQWHFFVFTNDAFTNGVQATNVAFATFMPPNLSQSRLLEPPGVAPRGSTEADIDLYVSTNAGLLNLDPNVMFNSCVASTDRGGTELVTFTNSTSNAVYYVGVKAEDQQAAEFGFFALATDKAFGGDENPAVINFHPLPLIIPDGYPANRNLQNTIAVGITTPSTTGRRLIRRVVLSDQIVHELIGDLFGTLTLGRTKVVLNNHTAGSTPFVGATNFTFTYDDYDEGDIVPPNYPPHTEIGSTVKTYPGAFPVPWMHTDGPGSLKDFAGKRLDKGVWLFNMTDNALNHTGQVVTVQAWADWESDENVLHQVRTIAGGGWFYDLLKIPSDATNLNIAVTYQSGTGPVEIYLKKGSFPATTNFDAAALDIVPPGGALNISTTNSPPLTPGLWFYGIHNAGATAVTIAIDITITRSLTPDLVQTITNQLGSVLLDDASVRSQILITNALPVVSVDVGIRLNHPRLSDLSIQLISPRGTHVMLFEARGRDLATALGLDAPSNTIYTIFTENTNKASQLIKFALPPYANISATTSNTVIASTGFDFYPEASYLPGDVVDGWTVTTNQVGVEYEPELNTSPLNYLALGSAGITQTFATTAGKTYMLSHSYHGPNVIDWWTADGNVKDLINTNNNGTFTNLDGTTPLYTAGKVGEAWHFDGTNTEVIINTNAGNFGTNDFTIEFWLQTISTQEMGIMEKRPICDSTFSMWSIRMGPSAPIGQASGEIGIEVSADNHINYASLVTTNSNLSDGVWHHIAFRRDEAELTIYVDGQQVADTLAPDIAFISNSVPMIMGQSVCQCCDGTRPFAGNLDEVTVFQRSLSPAEIYDIYAAGRAGKRSTLSVMPNISYLLNGQTNDTLVSGPGNTNFVTGPGDPWQTNVIGFTATNSTAQITIQGNAALGMLLDDVRLEELPNTNYNNFFFPEESLSAFAGELAAGLWTLEIRDMRSNAVGVLMDWELNITYSATNVNLITIEPGVCTNVTIGGHSNVYFAVDVPAKAKFATNILNNSGPVPLDLIFNQSILPTGTSDGDFFLMSQVGTGVWGSVLSKNSGPPFLASGERYYLAVRNLTDTPQPFCLEVDFDISTNFDITSLDDPPVPGSIIPTNVPAGSVQYYYYDILPDSLTATFEILNPTADVDMVISHDLPLPDRLVYDYGSFNAGTNDEFIVVRTNSSPVALTAGRWYITVYNSLTNPPNVTYTIRASQSAFPFIVLPLSNPPGSDPSAPNPNPDQANPGYSLDFQNNLRYYSFTITDSPAAVQFVISNMDGNCDLLARLNDYPTPSQFDFGSFNAGTTDELLVITTNSSLTSLNGIWYLGIPDNDPNTVNFTIAATEMAAGTLPYPAFASGTAHFNSAGGGSFTFTFNSIAGQTYYIEMSTDLVTWQSVAKITATTSTTTFTDVQPTDRARYYRLRTPR